jgi:hypothetical protein
VIHCFVIWLYRRGVFLVPHHDPKRRISATIRGILAPRRASLITYKRFVLKDLNTVI